MKIRFMTGRRWRIIIGILVVAALLGAWYGWLWTSTHGPDFSYAADRDAAVASAKQHISALNSIDPAKVDRGLQSWQRATTGPLYDELTKSQDADKKKVIKERTIAEGKVDAVAVTALDHRAGNATVIAAVRITVSRAGAAPTIQHKRFQAGLTRNPAGQWKIKSLTALGVGAL